MAPSHTLAQCRAAAEDMAAAARAIVLPLFEAGVGFTSKGDTSPVTEADRNAEAAIRRIIEARFPDHGILGEEYGADRLDADFVWVLDPIDGTKSFITGKPLFGTLIALLHEGAPVLGVMDMAAIDERWIGARGQPTTWNGQAITCRPCGALADAWLLCTTPEMHAGANEGRFASLHAQVLHTVYGSDCHGYGALARGRADLVAESNMQPYDYCALVPIVEGAGGAMADWSGRRLGLEGDGTVLAAGDPALMEQAIAALNP